ncbi:MAG: PpiC-type peptidyl-prolyl cis-trans isomerase [Gemmatimonadetes bacterium]|jgi:parvulin-like peptidyl-prolyl isomerase|nr:PpiC-type peptidyl-prolyl cis-trans isomerase [Gemmatimonadota bacterium]
MKRSSLAVLALSATTLAACGGLKDALTAHVDVVAKAGSQELSVTRLSSLLGNAKLGIPINKDVATLVARDLWVPYQLLALAAARGDSLADPKAIDAAAAGMVENAKLGRFMESVSAKLPVDSGSEAAYLSGKGDLFAARHILLLVPQDATPAAKEAIRRKAEALRAAVTPANFADVARKNSEDNTKDRGGDLGVFPRGAMVKPFADAVAALKPGEISPVIETQFGFHIIQRSTWDQAKAQYLGQAGGRSHQVAESTYIAQAQAQAAVKLKGDAAATAKAVAKDPLAHRKDNTVLASYNGGTLTAARLAQFMLASPQSGRLSQQIQTAPDSLVNQFVTNQTQRELLLKRADSAKAGLTPEEIANLHRDFGQVVQQAWALIGLDPKSLADSAKTPAERERLAAARVEAFLDRVMSGQQQPVPVPAPLQMVLMDKYDSQINAAGIDRAVEQAAKLRAVADSAHAASQPKSAVPMPGPIGGAPPAPSAAPVPAPAGRP